MTGLETTDPTGESDVTVYHAGTNELGGDIVTSGGRVIAVTGRGATLRGAGATTPGRGLKLRF